MFCFTRAAGAPRPLHARSALTRTLPRFARCGPFGPAAGPSGPLRALRLSKFKIAKRKFRSEAFPEGASAKFKITKFKIMTVQRNLFLYPNSRSGFELVLVRDTLHFALMKVHLIGLSQQLAFGLLHLEHLSSRTACIQSRAALQQRTIMT